MGKFIGIIESLPRDHRFGSKFEYDVWVWIVLIKWIKLDFETPDGFYEVEGWYCTVLSLQKWFKNKVHYKISQFYRRKYSIGVWLPVHQWFIYRRLHRQNTSVGFPFIGNSTFHRYIGRKHKKTICRWFYRRNFCTKKKSFPLEIYRRIFIPSVISWFTDGYVPSVYLSVSVWNTDRIYPSVNSSAIVVATVKCWRIHSVSKAVGECMKYRPNISVCKCVGECGQMPTDSFRR
jgi:hypothetical protein